MNSNFLKSVIEKSGTAFLQSTIIYDGDGNPCDFKIIDSSPGFLKLFQIKKDDIEKQNGASKAMLAFLNLAFFNSGKGEFEAKFGSDGYAYTALSEIEDKEKMTICIFPDRKNEIDSNIYLPEESFESKKIFESLFENLKSGCAVYSVENNGERATDYTLIAINKSGLKIEDKTKEELLGKKLLQIRVNIEQTPIMEQFREVFKTGKMMVLNPFEYSSDGISNYYENAVFKLDDNKVVAIYHDVTSAVESRIDAEKIKEKFMSYIQSAPYGIFVSGNYGKIMDVNNRAVKMIGYSREKLVGRNVLEFVDEADAKKASEDLLKARQRNERFDGIYRCRIGTGELMIWKISTVKLDEETFIGFIDDITATKRLEEKLLKSEKEYRTLFDNAGVGIGYYSTDGHIIWMNKHISGILGKEPNYFNGKSIYDVFPKDKSDQLMERLNSAVKIRGSVEYEDIELHGGREFFIVTTYKCITGEDGSVSGVEVIYIDITELRLSQKEVKQSEQKYSSMIENISDVIMVLGEKAEILYVSPNVEKFFGWQRENMIGKLGKDMIHPDDAEYVSAKFGEIARKSDSSMVIEFRLICKDGSYKYIHLFARNMFEDKSVRGVLTNFHDITHKVTLEQERNEMDQYVRNQQRLEAIGTLASGVAHEINNPINGILNYSQVILDVLGEDWLTTEKCAKEIMNEAERVSEIVRNLLGFSRQQKQEKEKTDIKDIIERTLTLLKATVIRDEIDLMLDLTEELPEIECKSSQIQQVIMNLVTNSRDSLNSKYPSKDKDKVLKISTEKIDKKGQEYIRVIVEDHGLGIPSTVQNRIFDPFFTTKSRDEGTGLGLSISYKIVKEHGGTLDFETIPNKYTKFYLDLPL